MRGARNEVVVENLMALIPLLLRERPDDGDPVRLAHWYIAGQGHHPCRPGSGCTECWSTLNGILDVAGQIPIEDFEDPVTEKAAQDLLELWYGSASTRIEVRFPGLPAFDPGQVPSADGQEP